jgi:hypothetical protein
VGTIRLTFRSEYTRFENYTEEEFLGEIDEAF